MTKEIQPDTYTPPPILSNSPKHDLKKDYEPLEGGCTLPNLINKILKNPLSIIHELEMKKKRRQDHMPSSFDCNRVLFCFRGHSRYLLLE